MYWGRNDNLRLVRKSELQELNVRCLAAPYYAAGGQWTLEATTVVHNGVSFVCVFVVAGCSLNYKRVCVCVCVCLTAFCGRAGE